MKSLMVTAGARYLRQNGRRVRESPTKKEAIERPEPGECLHQPICEKHDAEDYPVSLFCETNEGSVVIHGEDLERLCLEAEDRVVRRSGTLG